MKTLTAEQLKANQKLEPPSKDHRRCKTCFEWFHKRGLARHESKCFSYKKPNKRSEKKALKLNKKRKGFHNTGPLFQDKNTTITSFREETSRIKSQLQEPHGQENNFYQSTLLWATPSLAARQHLTGEYYHDGQPVDPFDNDWEDIPGSEKQTTNNSRHNDDGTVDTETSTDDDMSSSQPLTEEDDDDDYIDYANIDENDGFGVDEEGDPDDATVTSSDDFIRVLHEYVNTASMNVDPKTAFQFKDNIPMHVVAQIDLLRILIDRRVDMGLFDDIMEWIHHHSTKNKVKWGKRKLRKRKPLLKWIGKAFETECLEPIPKQVELSHSLVTVPCFDVVEQIMSLIYDSDVYKQSNLLQGNFDPKTWRPTADLGEDDLLNDIHTGSLYHEALNRYCPPGHTINGLRALGLPLIFFIDKTHSDCFGALATTPISFTLGIFCKEFRRKYKAWRHAGFLPNSAFGIGKHHITDEDLEKILPKEKLEDLHRMIAVILEPVFKMLEEHGGITCVLDGETVVLVPWIHLIIGDAVGNNELCGHYGGNNAKCLVKDCRCTKDQLIQIPPVCELITMDDVRKCYQDAVFAQSISRHQLKVSFDSLPLSDEKHGVTGITPFETLHCMGSGLFGYAAKCIHDVISPTDANSYAKAKIERLFKNIKFMLNRQSDRDRVRSSHRFGFFDCTRVTAMERIGNIHVFLLLIHTTDGSNVLNPYLNEYNKKCQFQKDHISIPDLIVTLEVMLAFTRWVNDDNIRSEVVLAPAAVNFMLEKIIKNLPRKYKPKTEESAGCQGWHIIKFHAVHSFVRNILKFGSASSFDGGPTERTHKYVKDSAECTQKQVATFTTQIAQRVSENLKINNAYNFISHLCMPKKHQDEYENPYHRDRDFRCKDQPVVCRGEYHLESNITTPQGHHSNRGAIFKHDWKHKVKNFIGVPVNRDLLHVISKFALNQGYFQHFEMKGYTEISCNNNIYRASPFYRGNEWYDWAVYCHPVDKMECPGKILGFVRYKTSGVPTYKLCYIDGLSANEIAEGGLSDNTVYAVVHATNKNLSIKEMEKNIVTPICLGDEDEFHMIPVDCIVSPLCAVPNYGKEGSKHYLLSLPYHKWGKVFSKRIHDLHNK